VSYWNACCPQFLSAQSLRSKTSDVGFESGTIEHFGDLSHLPLAAAKIQFASHE
jgi:hypothetical protein